MTKSEKIVARFWKTINKCDPDDCWEWQGKRDRDGYGVFQYNLKDRKAHRTVYGLTHAGDQSPVVMHLCDNPACCNPSHLRGGSQLQNMQDKVSKDRQARGSRNGRAKLAEKDVKSIKAALLWPYQSHAEIARHHGVSKSVIRDIKNRKTWSHVNMLDLVDIRVE